MVDVNGALVVENVEVDVKRKIKSLRKGPEQGTPETAPEKGPEEVVAEKAPETDPNDDALAALTGDDDAEDAKVLKWRFLAKGPALDALLKVFGAKAVNGDKQVSFQVGSGEKARELGDVVRLLFGKLAESGVTLRDLVALAQPKKQ